MSYVETRAKHRTRHASAGLRLVGFAAAAASGCAGITEACTLIGCNSGVTVHLTSLPTSPFRIEVRTPANFGPVYVFECNGTTIPCQADVFFGDLIAERLFVTVIVGSASRQTEIDQITYTQSFPNGRRCGGACQNAVVTADVPG
jgi:hypothetical protein